MPGYTVYPVIITLYSIVTISVHECVTLSVCVYQDSMFERMQWRSVNEQRVCLQEESSFLQDFQHLRPASEQTVCIELLQQLARLRLCLDTAAQLIAAHYTAPGDQYTTQHTRGSALSSDF